MRYQWEQCPNSAVNVLHLQVHLPTSFDQGGSGDEFCYGPFDDEDRQFLRAIADIPGVVSVSTDKHTCQIVKAHLFEWEMVRPQVVEIIRRRFRPNSQAFEAGPVFSRHDVPATAQPVPMPGDPDEDTDRYEKPAHGKGEC